MVIFAEILRYAFRESDVIGRLGGDEFAILAVSRDEVPDEALMKRFEEAVHDRNRASVLSFEVCASSGIARWNPSMGIADLQQLISTADARMYEAKRLKRPTVIRSEAT